MFDLISCSGSSSVGFIKSLNVLHGAEISTVPCICCWINAGCTAPSELEEGGFGGMPWREASVCSQSRECRGEALAQEQLSSGDSA